MKLKHRKVVWETQQAARPSAYPKHLSSALCVSAPPVASRGLDKWQVVLKGVPIQCRAEPHLDTLLQSGGGLERRGGNVEAGQSADCQNMSETRETNMTQRST